MSERPSDPIRGWRRAVVSLLLCLGANTAWAQATLILEVQINGHSTGVMGQFMQLADGQIAASRQALIDLGLKPPLEEGTEKLVALNSLPDLSYEYDEPQQRIHIAVADHRRIPKRYDAAAAISHSGEAQSGYGAIVNYTLFASSLENVSPWKVFSNGISGLVEARAFSPVGVLSQSNIVRAGFDGAVEHVRLDTAATHYDADDAITYRAGDIITGGLSWTRPIRVGGFQVRRSFDLRPDLVTLPLPSTQGSAAVPSTVDVYLNGFKSFSQSIEPGPYQLANLPVYGRGGTARVVVRDALGREVETSLPFFVSSALLAPGLVDFSFEVGAPRVFYATERDSYVALPVATSSIRVGVTEYLTLQGHAEGGAGLANVGLGAAIRVDSLGVVSGAVAGSQVDKRQGWLGSFSFETQIGSVSLYGSTQRTFGDYEDLASVTARIEPRELLTGWKGFRLYHVTTASSLAWSAKPPRSLDQLSVSLPSPFDTSYVGLNFIQQEQVSGQRTRIVSASWSRPLWRNASAYMSVFKSLTDHRQAGVFAGLAIPLGDTASASLTATQTRDGPTVTADAIKPVGAEAGSYGWRVRDTEGRVQTRSAAAAYRSNYGKVEAAVYQRSTGTQVTAELEGAVGILGASPFVSSRIDDAFAVVDAGAPGVQVLYENRPVATTDFTGRAVIPSVRSLERNRISIDPSQLPLSANVAQTEELVVPKRYSGVKVDFGVEASGTAAVVVLVSPDGKPLPPGLAGRSAAEGTDFVTGYDGRSYVSRLGPENTLKVDLPQGPCTASFSYAPRSDEQIVIGPVICQ